MVQKVTGFKTEDGQVFDTEALALAHEKLLSLGVAVKAALVGLGFGEAMVYPSAPHDDGSADLLSFLLDNSEALIDVLTPPKKERKPRAPKEPVAPNNELTKVLQAVAAAAPAAAAVETAPVNAEAGQEAEDELAALLGGEASSTASAEVAV